MNKNLYRVIFNAARGLLMAVQETASGLRKGARASGAKRRRDADGQRAFTMLPMRGVAFAALCVFGMQPVFVQAQVTAAPNAGPATKPSVGVTANGVPLVQITTPNAAGVSNNTYTQYNVGTQGLILNNSPGTTLTKQGGYVAGNPYLSSGGARVIVNQVVGGSPSQLLGYTEVAGQQAEVVIANPAGLYCNGCGFINTTRGVLTTGVPVFGGSGSLDAFHVTGGQIQIGAAGLNVSDVDQVDLIARSVQINGKIWAGRQLDVVAGTNDVNYADLATHALTPDANTPGVAIDVAQLGGMYAGKIKLVGTEAGVGVNSAGTIQAQAGDIQLSSAGKVTLAGSTSASGNVQIQAAGDVANSGTTYAAQNASVSSQGLVTNSGTLASQGSTTVSGAGIVSTGALGAGVDAAGHLGGSGNLAVTATGAVSATGQNVAGGDLTLSGSSLNLAGAQTLANGAMALTATGAGGDKGDVTLARATTSAGGMLNVSAAGALTNDQAQTGAGQVTATAASLSNRSGRLLQTGSGKATLAVNGDFDNTQGTVQTGGALSLTAANVTNAAGRVVSLSGDGLTLAASGQVTNTVGTTAQGAAGGVIGGNGNVSLQSTSLTNTGTVTAGQTLTATAGGLLDNSAGTMTGTAVTANAGSLKNAHGVISGSTVSLTIPQLDNSGGQITANQLSIGSTNLTNEGGTLTQLGTGPMSMTVTNALDNSNGGVLQTNSQDLTLAPATLNNNGGTITHAGTGALTIDAANGTGSVSNASGKIVSNGQAVVLAGSIANQRGSIAAGQALNVTASGNVDNTQGTLQSGGAASLTASNVTNSAGRIVSLNADGLTLTASGQVTNRAGTTAQGAAGGVIGGNGNVTIQSAALTNAGTVTAAQTLKETVGGLLDNSAGTMTGTAVTASSGSLKNAHGAISGSTVSLTIPQLDNSGGQITANQLSIGSTNLTNEGGTLTQLGTGPMSMTVTNVLDNSNGGVLQTNSQDLMLAPASLNNNGGTITHAGTGTLAIDAGNGTGSFTNNGGTMTSNGQIVIASGGVLNKGGAIAAGKTLTLTSGGDIDNSQGTLQSGGAASLTATNVTNAAGRIVSLDNDGLSVNASGQVSNTAGTTALGATGGVIGGNGNVTVQSASLTNSGTVMSGQTLKETVGGLLDNSSGTMSGAAVAANSASLKNAHGTISGSTVSLTIPQLDNSGGQITTNQLSIGSTNLTNEGGTLTQLGTGPMSMTVTNVLDNSNGGVLQTNSQDLTLAPASLNNNGGTITHAGTGTLTIDAANGTGSLTNASGRITSNGQANVSAGAVANMGGTLASRGAMSVTVAGAVNNSGGVLHSDTNLSGSIGASLTNVGGQITTGTSAGAGDPSTLSLLATSIDNTNGSILNVGSGATTLSGTSQIINSDAGGVPGMGRIGGNGNVTLTTATLSNTSGGQLIGANLQLNTGTLDNTGGQIGNIANANGDIGISATGTVYNGSGQISAARNLLLTASTFNGGGSFNGVNNVTLNLQGSFTNGPGYQFNSGNTLTFNLPGTFYNAGSLSVFNNLAINAGDIGNAGSIAAGGLLSTSSHTLTNTGTLVGGSVSLNASGTIWNLGATALIGATDSAGILEVLAPDIENRDDTTATDTPAQTSIYGLGRVALAGGKDASGNYTKANLITNQSALIQSGSDMLLDASLVNNTRRVLTTSGLTSQVDPNVLSQLGISMSGQTGQVNVPDPNSIGGAYIDPPHEGSMNSDYYYTTYTGTAVESSITAVSPKSQLVSGGNLWLNGVDKFQNYWSQVAATGNVALPTVQDNNSWRGTTAPKVQVTYSGLYHYLTYDKKWWTWSFCESGCNAPADIRTYALPGYDSTWSSNGTISGTGVTIINTGGNSGVTPLGLAPGQALPTTGSTSVSGDLSSGAVAIERGPQTVPTIRGTAGNNTHLSSTLGSASSVSSAAGSAPDPVLGKATALPVLTNLTVPQGGLFKPDTAPNAPYLVESNPAFTNLHQWISSDYYYQQMGMDPSKIQKRLGDGFYEQHLVQSQIMSLTGKAVLTDYADTQREFEALMTSGVALAKSLNLAPGVGLSADQVKRLTSNVVIMQTEVVDGQSVLVPVVYLAQASQENMGNGPVIEAANIDIENAQGIQNSGTIRATNSLTLTGQSIDSSFGTLQSGGQMTLATTGDINLTSGTVKAGSLALQTGGNLVLDTAVNTVNQINGNGATRLTSTLGPTASISVDKDALIAVGGNFDQKAANLSVGGALTAQVVGNWTLDSAQTGEHKVVSRANGVSDTSFMQGTGSKVSIGGVSNIGVGGDLTALGASINLGGGGNISAAGNVSLLASTTTSTVHSSASESGGHRNSSDDIHTSDDVVHGTTIVSGQSLTVQAGKNMSITGSSIDVQKGTAILAAAGDVNIGAATENHSSDVYQSGSHSGFGSKTSKVDHVVQSTQTADASTVSADSVAIISGKDLTVQGSNVVASNDVALRAKGNVDIVAAQNTYQDSELHDVKHSGFTGTGGIGIGYGSSEQKDQYDAGSVTQSQSRSTVGGVAGNVSIVAGSDVHIGGSDVIAGKASNDTQGATGNIAIQGQNIAIDPGRDDEHSHEQQDAHSNGFSIAVTGTPLDTARNLRQAASSGNGFKRLQSASNEVVASSFDGPSVSMSFNHSSSSSTTDIASVSNAGSTVRGGGNVSLVATGGAKTDAHGNAIDGDLTVTGSVITAGGVASLSANRDVVLQASTDELRESMQTSSSSSGFSLANPTFGDGIRWVSGGPNSGGVGASPYNASQGKSAGNSATTQQTASAVTGNSVVVTSKTGDINVIGSGISGLQGVDVVANQGAINVLAGTDTSLSHQESSNRQIGDLGSNGTGTGFSVGVSKSHMVQDGAAQTQSTVRGQVVSADGNVSLKAKQDLTVEGSDLSAGKDLSLIGQNVKLDPGTDALQNSMSQSASQFGVTVTVGGALGNAVATINQSMAAAQHTDNKRLAKLDEAQAVLSAYGIDQALNDARTQKTNLVKVTASVGGGASHSQSESNSLTNDGSTLNAGGNVTIVATGSGAQDAQGAAVDGDITARGTQINGKNVELNAARDIDLQSAQDTNHQTGSNSSSGGSIGVGLSFGGQTNGFTLELGASGSKGHMNGDGTTNRDTQVTASQTLSITSGRDTDVRGAEVSGGTVEANVGRDLNIASPQDTNKYESKQTSAGVQVSICVPPFCYGASGASSGSGTAGFNYQNIKDDYNSVGKQSGIYAGAGGFDINVGNHTQLDGGVIASKADASQNTLSTQTLGFTNLENWSKYSGTSFGYTVSGGVSVQPSNGQGAGGAGEPTHAPEGTPGGQTPGSASDTSKLAQTSSTVPGPTTSAGLGPTGASIARTSSDKSGTTYAAVSPGTITVRGDEGTGHDSTAGLSRDTAHANDGALTNTFDAQKVGDDLAIQLQTRQVGMQVAGDLGSYLDDKANAAYEAAKDRRDKATDPAVKAQAQADMDSAQIEQQLWSNDGAARTGLHMIVGGAAAAMGNGDVLASMLGAAGGDEASALLSPTLNGSLGSTILKNIVSGVAGAVVGAVVGGGEGAASGAGSALAADLYNRQLHPEEKNLAKQLAEKSGGKYTEQQIEDQMAQMNMTEGGQTDAGGVRVAVGSQPNDGTTWVPYGVNQAGQQVWAQSLPGGDANIQDYISQNANAMSASTGMTYQPTTRLYTQYSGSVSGSVLLPFVGAGGGVNVGISTDYTLAGTSPYIQFQANGMASAGAYAGVGVSLGRSTSNGQLTSGVSTGGYAEVDAGYGSAFGSSFAINDDKTIGGIGGALPIDAFKGAGFGAAIGAGKSTTTTIVLPSINSLLGK
ncbi:hemagglutinin repeat-containing protein [Trinickia diaoshuihuensis]|uniref:hemagglutinin repeat-containing protein n=1 Tax=Trinickia diaoshuihuensis TaxID=2292265 RepID=UPI000E25EF69|nr:hemagglutinin repeat-containing protein [Trinickia diaoshuihuensis]